MSPALVLALLAGFLVLWAVALYTPFWRYLRREKLRCERCGLSILKRHVICPFCGHVLGTESEDAYDQEQFQRPPEEL